MHGNTQGSELFCPDCCSRHGNRLMSCHCGFWSLQTRSCGLVQHQEHDTHWATHSFHLWLPSFSDHMTQPVSVHPVSQSITVSGHLCEGWSPALTHRHRDSHPLYVTHISCLAFAFYRLRAYLPLFPILSFFYLTFIWPGYLTMFIICKKQSVACMRLWLLLICGIGLQQDRPPSYKFFVCASLTIISVFSSLSCTKLDKQVQIRHYHDLIFYEKGKFIMQY